MNETLTHPARPPDPERAHVESPAGGVLDLIGNTPLIKLANITHELEKVAIYAKAEWLNPGGSVKDRAALNMIREGERTGQLATGKTILDASSGNTAVAYAMIGAVKGYPVRICLPGNASEFCRRTLRAYGADLVLTDPLEGPNGAIEKARELYQNNPDRYFYPDQYNNPANWRAHYKTTAREVYEQTGGRITHFVAGLGTSGTFVGTGRRLKELVPEIELIAVQPDSPFHGLEGLKHMASAITPGIYDPELADRSLEIGTEEAYKMTKRLVREEGLLVGLSSGAALAGALKIAAGIDEGVIVTVFPDGGQRYLAVPLWDDPRGGGEVMSITLKKAQQETIEVHGERAYPHEGCGLLVGRLMGGRKVIEEVRPLENAREHSRENRYLIPPAEIVKAERAARERGRAVLGFFHSHPDAPARPSPYDLEHASWPSYSYVIVSVKKGSAGELRSWVLRDDRSQFDPEEIVVQPEEIQPEEGVIHER